MQQGNRGRIDIIIGLQWGDEGKGKDIDNLLSKNSAGVYPYKAVARFQGGPNAGHTLKVGDQTFIGHHLPSGYFQEGIDLLIGNGVVSDPILLMKEIKDITAMGIDVSPRLFISERMTLIAPLHPVLDMAEETRKSKSGKKVGTTAKGIGPAYSDSRLRIALKAGDIFNADFDKKWHELSAHHRALINFYKKEYGFEVADSVLDEKEKAWAEAVREMQKLNITDVAKKARHILLSGGNILAEGAQGIMLDVDHGDYPNVTSSNVIPSAVCAGLGVSHQYLGKIYGVMKLYTTKVGGGAFPSKIPEAEIEEAFRKAGNEYGATTGRPRMCGWLDLVALRYAMELSGTTNVFISKADICPAEKIKVVTAYRADTDTLNTFPLHIDAVTGVTTEEFSGWPKMKAGAQKKSDIDPALVAFIGYLEKQFASWDLPQVSIASVGTGPDRTDTIRWN